MSRRMRQAVRRLRFAVAVLAFGAGAAHAQAVYKCVDAEQRIAFQATPCAAGERGQQIEIAAAPAFTASPDYAKPLADKVPARATRSMRAGGGAQSFECRTAAGAVFYRHSSCPSSIPGRTAVRDAKGRVLTPGDAVKARRIPREQACKGLRSGGREGHEHDESTPTYARNLGRDPCRRY